MRSQKRIIFGIDTGTHTGVAIWDCNMKEFKTIKSEKIHEAMQTLNKCIEVFGLENIHVRFEDARLRNWFGKSGREQLQGAGSIKRDCVIWQDYLTDLKVSFEAVAPKNNTTKLSSDQFKKLTKWLGKTNEHSRDAAMLVVGY